MKMHDYFNVQTCMICTTCTVLFGLGTVIVEFLILDCKLLENMYLNVCQMFILKSMLC